MAARPDPDDVSAVRSFYERYVEEHVPYHRSPRGLRGFLLRFLPYWSYREWRFWERAVPRCEALLDLGCARGREVFRSKAQRCFGVDLAAPALTDCARRYDGAALADLARLPFADGAFDCVVSSHVLGHVPAEAKPAVFAEMARVLRPGGRSVHVVETDGARPLLRWAQSYPELYRTRVLDPDGHVGLEPPSRVIERLSASGLHIVRRDLMDARTLHPRLWVKWFDNEYRTLDPAVDRAVRRARLTLASPGRLAVTEVALGLWHQTLGQWAPALDEALFLALVAKKAT